MRRSSGTKNAPAPDETPPLSEAAAALTLDVLKDARRNLPAYAAAENDGKIIAFKTGTSYGLRDAWCAAVTPEWTLVVWLGDPSGRPRANLAGLTAAAPAAVRVMLRLTQKKRAVVRIARGGRKSRALPALRRAARTMVPAENDRPCYKKRHEHGALPPARNARRRDKNNLARRARALLRLARKSRCASARLTITSPRGGATYTLAGNGGRLVLKSAGGEGAVYWFVDGEYIGSDDGAQSVTWPMTPGAHLITAADDRGSAAKAKITVKTRAPPRPTSRRSKR